MCPKRKTENTSRTHWKSPRTLTSYTEGSTEAPVSSEGPLIGPSHCREASASRTAARLIANEISSLASGVTQVFFWEIWGGNHRSLDSKGQSLRKILKSFGKYWIEPQNSTRWSKSIRISKLFTSPCWRIYSRYKVNFHWCVFLQVGFKFFLLTALFTHWVYRLYRFKLYYV